MGKAERAWASSLSSFPLFHCLNSEYSEYVVIVVPEQFLLVRPYKI